MPEDLCMSQAPALPDPPKTPRVYTAEEKKRGLDPVLEAKIDSEIAEHGKGRWCYTGCTTFCPAKYRHWRRQGIPFERLKKRHDMYHVGDDD